VTRTDAGDERETAEHRAHDAGDDDDPDGPFAARDPTTSATTTRSSTTPSRSATAWPTGAAVVYCPYCGEPSEVAVDPGGGRAPGVRRGLPGVLPPWRVTVAYRDDGSADVWAQTDDE
jgi:hypothetical protein